MRGKLGEGREEGSGQGWTGRYLEVSMQDTILMAVLYSSEDGGDDATNLILRVQKVWLADV